MPVKTAVELMNEAFDRLDYMVKTTAPHLQSFVSDVQATVQAALADAVTIANREAQASNKPSSSGEDSHQS
jgi:hypothetical protein